MISRPLDQDADVRQPSVGQRVRELRRQRDLTQQELAALAGLSAAAVYRIERDERAPSIRTLRKLATAFGCDLLDLVGLKSEA